MVWTSRRQNINIPVWVPHQNGKTTTWHLASKKQKRIAKTLSEKLSLIYGETKSFSKVRVVRALMALGICFYLFLDYVDYTVDISGSFFENVFSSIVMELPWLHLILHVILVFTIFTILVLKFASYLIGFVVMVMIAPSLVGVISLYDGPQYIWSGLRRKSPINLLYEITHNLWVAIYHLYLVPLYAIFEYIWNIRKSLPSFSFLCGTTWNFVKWVLQHITNYTRMALRSPITLLDTIRRSVFTLVTSTQHFVQQLSYKIASLTIPLVQKTKDTCILFSHYILTSFILIKESSSQIIIMLLNGICRIVSALKHKFKTIYARQKLDEKPKTKVHKSQVKMKKRKEQKKSKSKIDNLDNPRKEQETHLKIFECPVCFEIMRAPKMIYSCSNDHYICSDCLKDPSIQSCPICRQNYKTKRPERRFQSEQLLAILIKN